MNLQLENKLALVSGSTAGIGFAIAKTLAAEGARVIVNGRTEARVREAIASIRAKVPSAKLEGLPLDLSKADAGAQTTKRHPDVDILVNNLGVIKSRTLNKLPTPNGRRSLKPIF
jgi:NADP-dependent 3-hydroxy acid dehydrogenase YdfG